MDAPQRLRDRISPLQFFALAAMTLLGFPALGLGWILMVLMLQAQEPIMIAVGVLLLSIATSVASLAALKLAEI
jgi:hypothetical protein